MDRPTRFEDHRWVGDKRTQVAHDVDACTDDERIGELMAARTYLCFAPDTLEEARNRGYRRCGLCAGARAAAATEDGGDA
ncbi:MAG: hypothetical protein HYX34_15175 [Actinobacteria bacterium]|nr:hypothetical protein [Actinomycetota bacterium]